MSETEGLRAPSLDDFADIAQRAYARLNPQFRRMVGDVLFQVQDFADDETLEAMEMEDPFELTGLYQGVDLSQRSVLDPSALPSMVFLYRRPILDEWAEHGEITLGELIAHVLVHEIGHHFGLSDAQIHAIEADISDATAP
jgi:predicted Zn-dependent protease with MMP-like domain